MRCLLWLLLLCISISILSCKNKVKPPKQVVRAFIRKARKGDISGALENCSKADRKAYDDLKEMSSILKRAKKDKNFDLFKSNNEMIKKTALLSTIGKEDISGDKATVEIAIANENGNIQNEKMTLIKENGKWVIYSENFVKQVTELRKKLEKSSEIPSKKEIK